MNDNFLKKAEAQIREIKLSREERIKIMTDILDSNLEVEPTWSWAGWWLKPALALLVIIAVGAGTSLAAEGALPGDLLYPVKVKINEPVREVVTVSPVRKAHWEEEKINRRLEEAEALATQKRLNEKNREELESLLDDHVETFSHRIQEAEKVQNENEAEDKTKERKQEIEKAKKEFDKTLEEYSRSVEQEDKHWEDEQKQELKKIENKVKEVKEKKEKEKEKGRDKKDDWC